jgi:hypothetical protein
MGIAGVDTFGHYFMRVVPWGGGCLIVVDSRGRIDLPLGLLQRRFVCTGTRRTGRGWELTGCTGDTTSFLPWVPAYASPAGRIDQDPALGGRA